MTMHRFATLAEFACCLVLAVVSAQKSDQESPAAEKAARAAEKAAPAGQTEITKPNAIGRLDAALHGPSIRASKLIGMNIENSDQKSLGQVQDIVLNAETGSIQYVAVTYGGFLGVGDKLFAVPFEAFEVRPDPDNVQNLVLVLNVTQSQLEGEQGFDQDNWPNFADPKFATGLYERYRVTRRLSIEGDRRGLDVDIRPNGVEIEIERK